MLPTQGFHASFNMRLSFPKPYFDTMGMYDTIYTVSEEIGGELEPIYKWAAWHNETQSKNPYSEFYKNNFRVPQEQRLGALSVVSKKAYQVYSGELMPYLGRP